MMPRIQKRGQSRSAIRERRSRTFEAGMGAIMARGVSGIDNFLEARSGLAAFGTGAGGGAKVVGAARAVPRSAEAGAAEAAVQDDGGDGERQEFRDAEVDAGLAAFEGAVGGDAADVGVLGVPGLTEV